MCFEKQKIFINMLHPALLLQESKLKPIELISWISDWTASGERNVYIEFDLETTKLQVLTDSVIGSKDLTWIQFLDSSVSRGKGGGISIHFETQMRYSLGYCQANNIPHNKLGTDRNRIWTIEKVETRMKLFCNEEEIFDIETNSEDDGCRTRWSFDCAKIKFTSSSYEIDNASDLYRKFKTGKNLLCNNTVLFDRFK